MNLRRIFCLACPLALAMTLSAQDHSAARPSEPAAVEQTAGATAGAAQEGAEPKEAAPEGHHPEPKLFGKSLNRHWQFLASLINFIIFALIIYYFAKGALSAAFKSRAKELEELLTQAERDKAEGEAQIKALETRMTDLQGQLDSVLAMAESDAEIEKQKILEAARKEATLILAQVSFDIDSKRKVAEQELRALVAELAVQGATERLKARTQGEVAGKILDQSIREMGGVQ